jgi:hypothetical protein
VADIGAADGDLAFTRGGRRLGTKHRRYGADEPKRPRGGPLLRDHLGYMVAPYEQLVDRAGWDVLASHNVGNTKDSDPASPDSDERLFMLLRSRLAG